MPLFLDTHTHPINREPSLENEHSVVSVIDIINTKHDRSYCILDAPSPESVERFHLKEGIKCDWIEEVTSINEIVVDSSGVV